MGIAIRWRRQSSIDILHGTSRKSATVETGAPIFLDINMPGINGVDVPEICQGDRRVTIPTLMITANADNGTRGRGDKAGCVQLRSEAV